MAKQGLQQIIRQQQRLNLQQMMLGRLLEMSAAEFEEEIVRALEENPALTTIDSLEPNDKNLDIDDSFEDDEFDDSLFRPFPKKSSDFRQVADSTTDAESLEQQLADLHLTPVERETAHYIIGNLDSSGYLTRNASAIANDMAMTAGIEVDKETVEKMIRIVKSLDPAGIGASNLQECLEIQLERMNPNNIVVTARKIIGRHYKSFVNNKFNSIKEGINVDDATFQDALKLIRSLNPKPGAGLFDHSDEDRIRHISPDFIIDVDDEGRLTVSLAGKVPELDIDPVFRIDELRNLDSDTYEFIKERHDGAEVFIDAVKRRGSTLMSIMKAIIKLQPEFFKTFDISDLHPMVIRDVEKLTGLDKSVISRATSTKYMLCPDGIFLLKNLFNESAGATPDISRPQVDAVLRELIEHEDKTSPLTDDELAEMLNGRGMKMARRTVAKYRERLGYPVARLRRK